VPEGGLDAFRDALTAHANNALSDDDLGKVLVHDGALAPHDVTHNLCEALLAAAPFGRKNPEPTFLFANVRLEQVRTLKDAHIKARVQGAPTLDVIAFGAAARMGELQGAVDVLATPSINVWNGNATLQLRVKDFRKAGAT
jgi:single-stranded-DNA-specific exonuclease